mmetsp:Transcript_9827/g.14660  ORF Transcript_9827/g.14660 Transcript_9827/m.14660 type:complete len:398 (+) Transcript_9827:20-1213(+)
MCHHSSILMYSILGAFSSSINQWNKFRETRYCRNYLPLFNGKEDAVVNKNPISIDWVPLAGDTYVKDTLTYPNVVKFGMEKLILQKKSQLMLPGEFTAASHLPASRIEDIQAKCLNIMTLQQALSLRKQILVNKVVESSRKLWRLEREILDGYKHKSIKVLSSKYDQPAIALLRLALAQKTRNMRPNFFENDIKCVVKLALRYGDTQKLPALLATSSIEESEVEGGKKLSYHHLNAAYDIMQDEWDLQQMKEAKSIDQTSYCENYLGERESSLAWEVVLHTYLQDSNIPFYSEDDLKRQGSTSTPDVVFLGDNVRINNQPVKWIDCKGYYGSLGSKHFHGKLVKQIQRYNEEFGGQGAVLYRLSYSEELREALSNSCLVLDRGPLMIDDSNLYLNIS